MEIDQQAALLRAMRAFLNIHQTEVARGADVAENTLVAAEKAQRCSPKTWETLLRFYATRGMEARISEGSAGAIAFIVADARR